MDSNIMNQLTNHIFIEDIDDTATPVEVSVLNVAAGNTESGEFDMELTAGDIYDALQERLALARTRALMGERALALDALHEARAEYETYRDALQGFPLHSLEHAFTQTMQALCAEKMIENMSGEETPLAFTTSDTLAEPVAIGSERKVRPRKRASKAA